MKGQTCGSVLKKTGMKIHGAAERDRRDEPDTTIIWLVNNTLY